jgi:putative transposase
MKAILRLLLELKKIEVVEGSQCRDHVHLSIRIPLKYAVAEIMGFLKGKIALMLFDQHPEWRRRLGRDRSF